ncbi:hypothetical protein [Clostridium tertium]|uniref:hypothetical protein n=1 Tax=Clostridium tertium TaxID=1559 RepID=UPI0023B332EB|nr:hypothetical protein [Clostridium tertium]
MSYKKVDYLVSMEWYGNKILMSKQHELYKTLLVRNCATLNEVNKKIYENCKLKKSEWTITKVERLCYNLDIIE